MEMTDAKVVEKKIYEEVKKHDDYASKATGNAVSLHLYGCERIFPTTLHSSPFGCK